MPSANSGKSAKSFGRAVLSEVSDRVAVVIDAFALMTNRHVGFNLPISNFSTDRNQGICKNTFIMTGSLRETTSVES